MEVCVDNLASVAAAWEGGARRIELCSSLAEGGLTPTPGLAEAARALIEGKEATAERRSEPDAKAEGDIKKRRMQMFALIRPRGGDFHYSSEEIKVKYNLHCESLSNSVAAVCFYPHSIMQKNVLIGRGLSAAEVISGMCLNFNHSRAQ